jgi:superfamily I DNA/RNA helicase
MLGDELDWFRDRLLSRLRAEFGADAVVDAEDQARGDVIRVCTLNAVTGLESPIVFVLGARQLYDEEHSLRLSDEERAELIRDNTRKLYMGLTRAGQRLVLTDVGELPESLRRMSGSQAG